jgi:hypothetical protein
VKRVKQTVAVRLVGFGETARISMLKYSVSTSLDISARAMGRSTSSRIDIYSYNEAKSDRPFWKSSIEPSEVRGLALRE